MDKHEYLIEENWGGGFYELAIEFYPGGDDRRLQKALETIWNTPELSGPWPTKHDFMGTTATPMVAGAEVPDSLYGLLRLPGDKAVGCLTFISQEVRWGIGESDWLFFCIPFGMFERVYTVDYYPDGGNNPWMKEVDGVLISMAEKVYQEAPFNFASMGNESAGDVRQADEKIEASEWVGYIVSDTLLSKLDPDVSQVVLPSGLRWIDRIPHKKKDSKLKQLFSRWKNKP